MNVHLLPYLIYRPYLDFASWCKMSLLRKINIYIFSGLVSIPEPHIALGYFLFLKLNCGLYKQLCITPGISGLITYLCSVSIGSFWGLSIAEEKQAGVTGAGDCLHGVSAHAVICLEQPPWQFLQSSSSYLFQEAFFASILGRIRSHSLIWVPLPCGYIENLSQHKTPCIRIYFCSHLPFELVRSLRQLRPPNTMFLFSKLVIVIHLENLGLEVTGFVSFLARGFTVSTCDNKITSMLKQLLKDTY